jgi:hypothetical protein
LIAYLIDGKIRLPVELWVTICCFLSPRDRRSLAESCTRLFSIVHSSAPFNIVKIDNRLTKSTGWKCKDRLYLRSAAEVHWSGSTRNWAEWARLHIVLSILPTIPNIRLLSLRGANINGAYQAVIFGIISLRILRVHSCRFFPTTRPLPVSHITVLRVADTSVQTHRYLLEVLATNLEAIEVSGFNETIDSALQDGLVAFPKLSSFVMACRNIFVSSLGTLKVLSPYTSITTLCIFTEYTIPDLPSFDRSFLPALRSLTCRCKLATALIPGRPVTTYVEVRCHPHGHYHGFFDALSKSSARVTSLHLFARDLSSTLPLSDFSCQYLEQLTIECHCSSKYFPISGGWLHRPPRALVFPKLKRVQIWARCQKLIGRPPAFMYQRLLQQWFIPICPALEVFECLLARFIEYVDFSRTPEPELEWKMRRLSDGRWEQQGTPPIPLDFDQLSEGKFLPMDILDFT